MKFKMNETPVIFKHSKKGRNCFALPKNGIKNFKLTNTINKKYLRIEKNYQQINWTHRPLKSSHLKYAAGDVEFLPDIYTILQEKLKKRNRKNP